MAGTERYVRNSTADFLVFTKDSETDGIEVRVQDHEVWLTQKRHRTTVLMLTAVLLPNICGIFLRKMNYPKVQLVQNLHKLQIRQDLSLQILLLPAIIAVGYRTNSTVPHNSVNGQPKCWIHLPGRDMFWIRIGLLMGKSLMKITSTIWFPKYRKSAPASAALPEKLQIFMLPP